MKTVPQTRPRRNGPLILFVYHRREARAVAVTALFNMRQEKIDIPLFIFVFPSCINAGSGPYSGKLVFSKFNLPGAPVAYSIKHLMIVT